MIVPNPILLSSLLTLTTASPNVLPLKIRRADAATPVLHKRASDFSLTLVNDLEYKAYLVEIQVGTPPQTVSLQLDTGSADLWMMGPKACNVSYGCFGGTFDSTKSSTAHLENVEFAIQYDTPGSGVTGYFFDDKVVLGGASMTSVIMAQATQAIAVPGGIMGVSFDTQESYVAQQGGSVYGNIMDMLVNQSIINTRAYSLYLDDREATTGQIIFGGYDTEKYYGSLSPLPLQPNAQTGEINSMSVVLNNVAITTSNGSTILSNFDFPYAVLLDSGTSLTAIPQDMFDYFMQTFGAEEYEDTSAYTINCDLADSDASIDFQFGGEGGPVIQVPLSEYVLPALNSDGSQAVSGGKPLCIFGMQPTPAANDFLLGDTFCRSAYIVYDLDNTMIYIAQTRFGFSGSNVQEIGKSGPAAVSQGTDTSATNSATGVPAPATSQIGGSSLSKANPTASASLGGATGTGGVFGITSTVENPAATTAATTSATAAAAGTSSSKGAAVALRVGVSTSVGWLETCGFGAMVVGIMFGAFY